MKNKKCETLPFSAHSYSNSDTTKSKSGVVGLSSRHSESRRHNHKNIEAWLNFEKLEEFSFEKQKLYISENRRAVKSFDDEKQL